MIALLRALVSRTLISLAAVAVLASIGASLTIIMGIESEVIAPILVAFTALVAIAERLSQSLRLIGVVVSVILGILFWQPKWSPHGGVFAVATHHLLRYLRSLRYLRGNQRQIRDREQ